MILHTVECGQIWAICDAFVCCGFKLSMCMEYELLFINCLCHGEIFNLIKFSDESGENHQVLKSNLVYIL